MAKALIILRTTVATIPKFGLDFVGDIPWGTHLCLFYETKDDLKDILVPYFAEGLRSNEACVWVTSEPFLLDEAREALAKVVGNLDPFIKSGQLFILPFTNWHMKEGTFDADRVLQGWIEKEVEALDHGFEGLRLGGNTFWIERNLWDTFTEYEAAVNDVFIKHRIIALCPYSLEKCTGSDVADVMRNHVGTIIRKGKSWSVVEDVMHRKEIEENVRQQAQRAETLRHIISAGNRSSDLGTACSAMLDTALNLLPLHYGWIFLLDQQYPAAVVLQATNGLTEKQREWAQHIPLTQGLTARVMAGTPLFYDDYPAVASPDAQSVNEVQSMAFIPLAAGDTVLGFYALGSRDEKHHFSDDEQQLLIAIGEEAGTVIGRLKAEEALKSSEIRYRHLVEISFDAVLIHSDGVIRLANEAAARILKADSPDALVGMNILDLPSAQYRALVKERITALIVSGQSATPAEVQYTALDGTIVDVEALGTPTTYNGRPASYVVFRDISERKRLEARLKEYSEHLEDLVEERTAKLARSEEEFRALFEASSIAQGQFDADGHPVRINAATKALLGIADVASVRHLNLLTSLRVPSDVKLQLKARQPARFEMVYDFAAMRESESYPSTRSDVRYIDYFALPLFDPATGSVTGYLAQLVDITERKDAEAALRTSEEQYRTLVETANSSIFTLDTEGTITYVNDYGARCLGYSPNELIGQNVMILVPETESSGRDMTPYIDDIVAHPDEHSASVNENVTKDGRRLWFNWVNKVLTDDEGHHIGHLAIGNDITELKRVQDSLLQSKEQLQRSLTMVDLANEAIIVRDLDDRITYWNHGAERLYGWSADEASGAIIHSFLHTKHRVPLKETWESLRTTGGWVGDLDHTTKDGRRITVESRQTLQRTTEEAPIAVFEINTDITEKKATEDALRDAQRLAGIGETAAMIGHDLRNPLQGLQYIVDLQKLRFEKIPPEKRSAEDWQKEQTLFDRISEQIFYMDKIVGDLQDYA
jgi:PAS domain S-box-containing protein